VEVFHLARFVRAFFFCATRCATLCAIQPAIHAASGENEKGEPADEFAFVCVRRLVLAVTHTLPDAPTRARPDLTSTRLVRP
jgi:hypothetical protein